MATYVPADKVFRSMKYVVGCVINVVDLVCYAGVIMMCCRVDGGQP